MAYSLTMYKSKKDIFKMDKTYQIAVGNYIYIAVKIGDRIKVVQVVKNNDSSIQS